MLSLVFEQCVCASHAEPLTCDVELWGIIKCHSDISQHCSGAGEAVILKYVLVFSS